jgi:hypothetical protein
MWQERWVKREEKMRKERWSKRGSKRTRQERWSKKNRGGAMGQERKSNFWSRSDVGG